MQTRGCTLKKWRVQNYLRWLQISCSVSENTRRCRQKSPQVTCGNLPAPAGNLREAFIVRVRADFLKTRDASFYPVPMTFTGLTFAAFEVNGKPFKSDSVPKKLDCSLFAPQSVIQKIH